MPENRRQIRLQAHLWSHLDGMAEGLGVAPELVLRRAVTTLVQLHGYSAACDSPLSTDPGLPPFAAAPTDTAQPRVELQASTQGGLDDEARPTQLSQPAAVMPRLNEESVATVAEELRGLIQESQSTRRQQARQPVGPGSGASEEAEELEIHTGEFVDVEDEERSQAMKQFIGARAAEPPRKAAPKAAAPALEPDLMAQLEAALLGQRVAQPGGRGTVRQERGPAGAEAPSGPATLTELPASSAPLPPARTGGPRAADDLARTAGLDEGATSGEHTAAEPAASEEQTFAEPAVSEEQTFAEPAASEEHTVGLEEQTHALEPGRVRGAESATAALEPAHVPWPIDPEPLPASAARRPGLAPPAIAPVVAPVAPRPAPPPEAKSPRPAPEAPTALLAPLPPPAPEAPAEPAVQPRDSEPARVAAAARIRELVAEVDAVALPREDRPLDLEG